MRRDGCVSESNDSRSGINARAIRIGDPRRGEEDSRRSRGVAILENPLGDAASSQKASGSCVRQRNVNAIGSGSDVPD